jgi:RNA polymerase sigma-70 factor (ECF subfamily)
MEGIEEAIVKNLRLFIGFTRKRVGDEDLAEDLVQDALVKALAAPQKPETEEDTVNWFYRILRHAIIDLYRHKDSRRRALERFSLEVPEQPDAGEGRLLCECFRRLLPSLPHQYRDLLERIDLAGEAPDTVAAQSGLTRNNLNVRLHRARRHLRGILSANCRACSKHGCLDCTCEETHSGNGHGSCAAT